MSSAIEESRTHQEMALGELPESCVVEVMLHFDAAEACHFARLSRAFCGAAAADCLIENMTKEIFGRLCKRVTGDHKVETINDGMQEFLVDFHGPKDSLYEGGVWRVRTELPHSYPYKLPSVGFVNKIYHPNVDENSGSVCLNVLNQILGPLFGGLF